MSAMELHKAILDVLRELERVDLLPTTRVALGRYLERLTTMKTN